MTKAQYSRENLLLIRAQHLREVRDAELRMLAESRMGADPRYVEDAIAYLWSEVLKRKLQMRDSLSRIGQQRVDTLVSLYS